MNKFKFEPPKEHRRTLQSAKSEHVPIITLLQKCTQIVREDRLWLHTQIKNNNSEVLEIFKQFPKPSQFQQLQVKLRKYVHTLKNQFKADQLSKFKETLRLNSLISNTNAPQHTNSHHATQHSISKHQFHLKPDAIVNSTTNLRNHKSQERTNMFNPLQIHAKDNLHNIKETKYREDAIEERGSQNVTSRTNRLNSDRNNNNNPLQQYNLNPYQSKIKQPKLQTNNLPFQQIDQKFGFPDFLKMLPSRRFESKIKPQNLLFSQSQKFKEKVGPMFLQQKDIASKDHQLLCSQKQFSFKNTDKQHIQINQDFIGQGKTKSKDLSRQNISLELTKQFDNQIHSPKKQPKQQINADLLPTFSQPLKIQHVNPDENRYKPTQAQTISLQQTVVDSGSPQEKTLNKMDQNLFTPLDLLAECRSFLRQRQNSIKKQEMSLASSKVKEGAEIKLLSAGSQLKGHLQFKPKSDIQTLKKQTVDQIKQQDPYFNIASTKKTLQNKADIPKAGGEEVYDFQNYQTFNRFSNSNLYPQVFTQYQINRKTNTHQIITGVPLNFTIEHFLENLMEITDMSPFITAEQLTNFINGHQHRSFLKVALSSYLSLLAKNQICITQIACTINKYINQTTQNTYPQNDQTISSVYNLLDISQKGYIDRQDIEQFLNQIKQAVQQNSYEQISQQLWRLFEGADFNNQQRLSYWNLFTIKNSDEFSRVSELLNQFEFQIEHN